MSELLHESNITELKKELNDKLPQRIPHKITPKILKEG